MRPMIRAGLRILVACGLLLVGFGTAVAILFRLQLETGGAEVEVQGRSLTLAATYFRVVFFKGLLPQLLLALALWPIAERLVPTTGSARMRRSLGLVLASLIAWLVVAPLLVVDLPGWPAFHMRTVSHWIGTAVTSVLAVGAAAGASRALVRGRREMASD